MQNFHRQGAKGAKTKEGMENERKRCGGGSAGVINASLSLRLTDRLIVGEMTFVI